MFVHTFGKVIFVEARFCNSNSFVEASKRKTLEGAVEDAVGLGGGEFLGGHFGRRADEDGVVMNSVWDRALPARPYCCVVAI